MKVKYDDKQIELSEQVISDVTRFMTSFMIMMQRTEPEYKECWVVGACKINDLSTANGIDFHYGDIESFEYLKKGATIIISLR